ncbi:Flp family type IVb pilin [Paenibacillus alkalitolerans]|uniref:Flp family type IVb pilin n=1 Tax=Paenibacillus alkalitolerans TaxID=2799335 RepID=UPI0018F67D2A|nr:Flp family type IVb pilin [Paenibacillus alkalitolerans]
MLSKFKDLVRDEQGQGLTEYGLVLGVIAIAVIGVIALLRDEIVNLYEEAVTDIQNRDDAEHQIVNGG